MSPNDRKHLDPRLLAASLMLAAAIFSGWAAHAASATDIASRAMKGGATEIWPDAVARDIAASEYHLTWRTATLLPGLDAAWHAPNRAHNFRSYFTEAGPRVIPRHWDGARSTSAAWEWSLRLVAWGRPGAELPVDSPRLRAGGDRIEYDRDAIVEWYLNHPEGLEQGFTIAEPPPRLPEDDTSIVVIDLALGGTLMARVADDGQAVDFGTSHGSTVVHYAQLAVTDALGKELVARMEELSRPGLEGGIRIAFDESGAVYPITVDPLATSPAWTAESDQVNALYGGSAASAGDVNGDGYADVIVGASAYDDDLGNQGRVYVYQGSASGLETTPSWTAESDQAETRFGISVASAGDVNGDGYSDVIVGAHQYGTGDTWDGRAFVYHGSATGLATSPAWTEDSDLANVQFGRSVASAGDVNGDGYSDVIVGAPAIFETGPSSEGYAFVYHGSASGLETTPSWTGEGNQTFSRFGYSVDTAGDVDGDGYSDVIVGAYLYNDGQTDEGRAFVYHGSASGLETTASWTAESNQASAQFGYSVGAAGDVDKDGYSDVIVGAVSHDNVESNEGRAFVYHGSASGLETTPGWTAESNQPIAQFGFSAATAGDVDGDGYSDVIVGASLYDNGQTDQGRAYAYLGSGSGLATSPVWSAEGDRPGAQFGSCVATAGDVNGDGHSDVIVGSGEYDNDQANEGRAWVYHGAGSGPQAGRVPDGSGGAPLRLAKAGGAEVTLSWGASCLETDTDYEIYEGTLGDFKSHTSIFCTTSGATTKTLAPAAANRYYLVVPRNATREGSYGKRSSGAERPAGLDACLPRHFGGCP